MIPTIRPRAGARCRTIGRTSAEGCQGLRLAVATDGLDAEIDGEIASAVEQAVQALGEAGMSARPVRVIAFDQLNALRRVVMLAECAAYHREQVLARRGDYNPQTVARLDPGFALSGVDYLRALSARGPVLERFCAEIFADADVLALPATPVATPRIADTDTGGDARFVAVANRLGALLGPINYLGLPALSVPIGFDNSGMPVGLQLVARPFAEPLLLRVAHAFAQTTGHGAQPPPFPGRA